MHNYIENSLSAQPVTFIFFPCFDLLQVLTLAESIWKLEGKGALDVVQRGRPPGQRAGGEEWKVDLGKQKVWSMASWFSKHVNQ